MDGTCGPWAGCPYLGARCPYWRKGHIHVAFLGGDFAAQVPSRGSGQLWMRLREGAWPHGLMAQDKGPSRTWQGGKGSTEGGEGAGALGGWAAPGGAQGCLPEEEVWSGGLEDANAGAWRSEGTARRRVQGTGCGRRPWGPREDSSEKGHRGPNQRGVSDHRLGTEGHGAAGMEGPRPLSCRPWVSPSSARQHPLPVCAEGCRPPPGHHPMAPGSGSRPASHADVSVWDY